MRRRLEYAEALRELWPPSVTVPSVAGSEQIRFPFAGGYATWGCATPIFVRTANRRRSIFHLSFDTWHLSLTEARSSSAQ
jgi:hypothetical protein